MQSFWIFLPLTKGFSRTTLPSRKSLIFPLDDEESILRCDLFLWNSVSFHCPANFYRRHHKKKDTEINDTCGNKVCLGVKFFLEGIFVI